MQFPGVLANDSVSLEIKRGEVFWPSWDENRLPGKSTLMNILYGLHRPTWTEIYT